MLRSLAGDTTDQDLCSLLISLQDHHWRIRRADLDILLKPDGSDWLLGSGAYAKVYRGILNKSIPVAIKTMEDQTLEAKQNFVEEIVALMNLRHANIVQFYGAVIEDEQLLLITEYMPRGSLYDLIAKDTEGKLTWYNRGRLIALDIVRGLMHMHCADIIHQDIKSKNILITKDYIAKLSDMGLFTMPKSAPERNIRSSSSRSCLPGTFEWLAPEVLLEGPEASSAKSDIYSLGVVLSEIITGRAPEGRAMQTRFQGECPPEVAQLVEQCLENDSDARPSIQDVFDVLSEHQPPMSRPLEARKLHSVGE